MATLYLDPAKIDEVLHSPQGVVGRDMIRRGQNCRNLARATCPRGPGSSNGRHLWETIELAVYATAGDIFVAVGSADRKMAYVVGGTRAHEITPKSKRALSWKSGGTTVTVSVVKHPGTKPNDFMQRALLAARL